MPNLNYNKIANILCKTQAEQYRLTDNGGMVVITADGRRLSFTPAEVSEAELVPVRNEADLPMVQPGPPRVEPRPAPAVIVAPPVEQTKPKSPSFQANADLENIPDF